MGYTQNDCCQDGKIPSTMQPRLAVGHPHRLRVNFLVGPSCEACLSIRKNGSGHQMFYNSTAFISHVRSPLLSWL